MAVDYIRPSAALGLVRQDTRTDRTLLLRARPVQVGLRSTDRRMRTRRDNVWLMSGPGGIVPHRRAGATETKITPPTTLAEALPSLEDLGITPELVEAALKICEVERHTAELMPQVAAAASEGCRPECR